MSLGNTPMQCLLLLLSLCATYFPTAQEITPTLRGEVDKTTHSQAGMQTMCQPQFQDLMVHCWLVTVTTWQR